MPTPVCTDDASYRFPGGVRSDGSSVTWRCADWTGYACAPGGYGVTSEAQIAALLEACPASCADGRCHNASLPARLLPPTGAAFEVVREGHECGSANLARGLFGEDGASSATGGLQECANACFVEAGCAFFVYGVGGEAGRCWQETTADATCAEGWVEAEYNFYRLIEPSPPAPGSAASAGGPSDEEVAQMFELFDTDHSGTIDASELHAMLQRMGYASLTAQQLQAAMEELDLDSSGTLDLDEFEQLVQAVQDGSYAASSYGAPSYSYGSADGSGSPPTEEELRAAFDAFDTDGDGAMSVGELGASLRQAGYDLPAQQLVATLHELDLDGSDSLSFDEWRSLFDAAAAAGAGGATSAAGNGGGGSGDGDGDADMCADDASYRFPGGVRSDGSSVTWRCADWTGYACAPGGYGVTSEAQIAALLEACPASCADGRCHNASLPARLLPPTGAAFEVVREGHECGSANLARGLFGEDGASSATGGLQECANACFVEAGCAFFVYGVGGEAGRCWQETTADATCAEGWVEAEYNFYRLIEPSPPAPPPADSSAAYSSSPPAPPVPSPPLGSPIAPAGDGTDSSDATKQPSTATGNVAVDGLRLDGSAAGETTADGTTPTPIATGVRAPGDDNSVRLSIAGLLAVAIVPLLVGLSIVAAAMLAYRRLSPSRRHGRLDEEFATTTTEMMGPP